MGDKVLSMREAIARHVGDGMGVVMGTALESLIPFAAGHEIIRQGRRDLTLIGPISDILFDQLIGAGCVRKVIAAWVGNVSMGSCYNFRRALEHGIPVSLEMEDHSNFTLALALHAQALGVSYLPTRTALGSDLPRTNPLLREVYCPFTGERLMAVRALAPDVAIVQAQRADEEGNAHLWGNLGVTVDAIHASRAIIVVAEEIVSRQVIRSDPNRTLIPGFLVSAVVPERWGTHPSSAQGYTNRDHQCYIDYHEQSRTVEGFQRWLQQWVLGVKDRQEYIPRLGADRLDRLRVSAPAPSYPAAFGY